MFEQRRIPGLGAIIAIAFLILPIVAVTWWLARPKGDASSAAAWPELDVVCLGRVDGLRPIATLDPPSPGQVVEICVAEGQPVKAHEMLLRLNEESVKLRMEEAEQAVSAAKIEVDLAQLELALQPRRRAIQEAAVAAANDRLAAANQLLQEKKKAAKEFGTVTAAELIAAESEVRQLEHLAEAEKARLEELEKLAPALKLKVQSAEVKKAMAETGHKQAAKALRDCVLYAPMDGTILRIQTAVGESVVPGGVQPAIVFHPAGGLIVRAELEQEFLGRVKPGMKAIVRDDVRPDSPVWNGQVQRVGNWVARKRSVLFDPGEVNDVRTVECIIVLDGKPEGLLVGQRMRVRIGKQD